MCYSLNPTKIMNSSIVIFDHVKVWIFVWYSETYISELMAQVNNYTNKKVIYIFIVSNLKWIIVDKRDLRLWERMS